MSQTDDAAVHATSINCNNRRKQNKKKKKNIVVPCVSSASSPTSVSCLLVSLFFYALHSRDLLPPALVIIFNNMGCEKGTVLHMSSL